MIVVLCFYASICQPRSQCEGESIAPTETPSIPTELLHAVFGCDLGRWIALVEFWHIGASVHPVVPPLPRVAAETKPMPNPDQDPPSYEDEWEVCMCLCIGVKFVWIAGGDTDPGGT